MNDTSLSDASKMTSTSLEHASFPPFSSIKWETLRHLAAVTGEAAIQMLLTAGSEAQQRPIAQEFRIPVLLLDEKDPCDSRRTFSVALRKDYSVTASQAFDFSPAPAPKLEPEPM
ncbi:hypothetical protein PPTG_01735 [Phytophthora nicotianae INRA-310]|uniref:Uncharacterized protein n=1 Tax=Phytophthora nicotianae (strain INRA-310) TaxID=761204 RepID=W2R866_PHYN3|nr:hypothetical protein PPTG_01735 [Phytophthora nicotianae INRA-310]ETN21592.1 hypothetical protein PPTG_01735 [Phytophthora nicotianae INRA-310]